MKQKKGVNIKRVISKISVLAFTLWIGSDVLTAVADSMNGTSNIFAKGLALIGFNHVDGVMSGTVSSSGIISVIGVISVASIVLEFLEISF